MNTQKPESDWLVMLYLAGDNDLFEFAQTLLGEAKRVGSSSNVKVVAEHDPADPALPTRRGEIVEGHWDQVSIGKTQGSPADTVRFIQWAKREFPAKRRALVFFDHGNGWQNVHVFEPVIQASGELRLRNVVDVVTQEPTDVLCFDSCLMAMIEIVYELRDRVRYIVASENVVPADSGWPYDAILRSLTLKPNVTPEQVAIAIVNGFGGSYNVSDQPVTLTAIELTPEKVDAAVKAINALACVLIDAALNGRRMDILFARRYAQSFGNPDYIDIVSFCDELRRLPDEDVQKAAYNVRTAIADLVIAFTRSGARSIAGANGLSIYFPDRPISPLYRTLSFAQPTTCMWSTLLRMLVPPLELPVEWTKAEIDHQTLHEHDRGVAPQPMAGGNGGGTPPSALTN